MKARVSQLHRTEAEWLSLAKWVPEAGELVVYDPDAVYPYARVKIGDGQRSLSELDFFVNSTVDTILQKLHYSDTLDGGRITDYLN